MKKSGNKQRAIRIVVAIEREGIEKVFNSQKEAAKWLGVSHSALWFELRDFRTGSKALRDRGVCVMTYDEYFDLQPKREHKVDEFSMSAGAKGRPVHRLDRYTHEILETYRNMSHAKRKMGLPSVSGISKCCRGEIQYSAGYKWEFADLS